MKGPDVTAPLTDPEPDPTPGLALDDGLLLDMRKVTKRFPGVVALSEVDFDVRPGEVHALVGENGAGKSTLIKILAGVYVPDGGEMSFRGHRYAVSTPRQARDAGIVTIHQELNLVAQMSVTENIFLGTELQRGPLLDRQTMHTRARALLARLHLDIDPTRAVGGLGVGQQQMVEVAKALHLQAHLIIMDEPTASLSKREIDDLFQIVGDLKRQGVSIIFISHHLEETFEISDRTTVLRDGRHIATMPTTSFTVDSLIRMMVGRELSEQIPKHDAHAGPEVLRVEGLTRAGAFSDINLRAHAGEIVGFAGMVGAGRTEVVRAIFGADPVDSGRVFLDGEPVDIRSPQDAIRHGIALLTEDRKGQGLVLQFDVRENISLAVLGRLTQGPWTSVARETSLAAGYIDRLSIKASSQQQLVTRPVGWHAAEGRPQQVAGDHAQGAHLRRADPRHRCGGQGRDLPHHVRARRPGRDHPDGQFGAPGDPRHQRPDHRHAGWPDPRRDDPGGGDPGGDHRAGDVAR